MLERLQAGAAMLGCGLSEAQLELFDRFRAEILDWNQRVNLTSITDPDEVELRHFLDSLTTLAAIGQPKPGEGLRILDVGSGAGLPGVPLAIVLPDARVTLLEATGKKVAFLMHLVERLLLGNTSVLLGRAEDLGQTHSHRESYDLVVARGVAPLAALAELCLPLVAIGGSFVAMNKGDIAGVFAASAAAIARLGGAPARIIRVTLPLLADNRCLVVSDKSQPTPARYPRRPGMPAKHPLLGG